MFTIAFRGFGNSSGGKIYGQMFVYLWFGLLGKKKCKKFLKQREIQKVFKTKRDSKGRCAIYFTFPHLCGLLFYW